MFSLEKVKENADIEELYSHITTIFDKLHFILKNEVKFSLTPENQHLISSLIEKTIPEIFENYLSFPLEYRNKNIVHDGHTLKQLLVKQLTEINYQVNTIEKTVFQSNELVAVAQLKQLESSTIHNNEFEPSNQTDIQIPSSFDYDSYLKSEEEKRQAQEKEALAIKEELRRATLVETQKDNLAYQEMKQKYPYQFESADKYSQESLNAMLANSIANFSHIDDIDFENKFTIRIDPKNVSQIDIKDVILKHTINPKLKFFEQSIVAETPKAMFYSQPVAAPVATLSLPQAGLINIPLKNKEDIKKDIKKVKGKKGSILGFVSILVCAVLCWSIFAPSTTHNMDQQIAMQSAQDANIVAKLNQEYSPVRVNYRATTTGKPYTIIFKGFDPSIIRLADVSVVGDYYNKPMSRQAATIKYNNQYYDLETGYHVAVAGFYAENVTDGVIVLQRYKANY